jgi:hypothetical protein
MAAQPLVVKISANIEALKSALALGQQELIKTAAGATALARSMDGSKLEQNALQMAVAIKSVGGAATLTAAEAKKADAAFQAWLEKAAKTGKEIPPELARIAKETALVASESAKVEKQATLTATAIKNLGGAAKLTVDEAKKADQTFTAWMATAAKTGQQVTPEMQKLAAETKKVAEETTKAEQGTKSWLATIAGGAAAGQLLATGITKAFSLAIDAVKALVSSMVGLVDHTIKVGTELHALSLKTGASIENLSRLQYVSKQTGVSFDSFSTSMFKMQVNLAETGTKAATIRSSLGALGLDMKRLKDSKPDEAFLQIMFALEKLPNRADQARIGMDLFGKGFKDMAGLTKEGLKSLMDDADRLGVVMSTEMASAARVAGDAITDLRAQFEMTGMRVAAAFMPAIIGIAKNLTEVFIVAVAESNKKLDEMGKPSGFIATVARAMGSGNDAIAAQVELYEALRDAIISFVRGAVVPAIKAFADVMILFNASKVVFGDLAQIVALLGFSFKMAALGVAEFGNFMSRGYLWADDVKRLKRETDEMWKGIEERGKRLQEYKRNEEFWANGAQEMVAKIDAAMNQFAETHIDVQAIIERYAKASREAYGGVGNGATEAAFAAEEAGKKLETLTLEADRMTTSFAKLTASGASNEVVFKALGSWAESAQAKFAELGMEVPKDLQKVVDAVRAIGLSINVAKWLEQQRADIRKILEASAKETEALVAKQRDAVNKAFLGNVDAQMKAARDLEKLEADSLEKRLNAVRVEMSDRRRLLDENASNYASALATIDALEERAANEATQAWLDHVAALKTKVLGPSFLDIFRDALKGIPDIITAAFTGGGGIGGAISGVLSNLGGALGEKLGGMLARALDGPLGKLGAKVGGAIFNMIPGIGGALGSLVMPALDKAWGWISKRENRQVNDLRDAYISAAGGFDKLVEQARKAGVELNSASAFQRAKTVEEWNRAVADLDAKLKKVAADRQKMLADVMAGERLATAAFITEMQTIAAAGGDAAKEATDYFNATLKQAASGLTQMFAGLEKGATAAAQAAAVKLHMAAGMSEEAAKKAAASVTGVFVKTQAQATGLGSAIAATFAKMVENGATFSEALAAIKGPLDTMRKQLELTGLQGGAAFEHLSRMGQIADGEISGPLVDAISGVNQALMGLHNSGILNQEMFAGLAATATDAYAQLIAQGVDGQAALAMITPTLQTMWEMQQQFGYEVDAATQELIDQAVAAGQVGEAHMSAQERTAKSMEKVATIMEAIARKMGVDLPEAAATGARKINDAFANVDPTIAEPWADWDAPPSIKIPYEFVPENELPTGEGMASGGVVYAAGGWTSKGSDIVPAMLTPGERVLTVGQNYDYEHRMRQAESSAPAANVAITIHALDPIGLKQVVEREVVPLLVSAYRRNVNGARTETRKELVE